MQRTPSKAALSTRLAAAQLALAQIQLQHAQATQDAAGGTRSPRSVPKPATGQLDAVVTFGTYAIDGMADEEGYLIGFRAPGVAVQQSTLIADLAPDDGGPDLAPGDTVRLERVGNHRHKLIRIVRKATARRPIDWLAEWHSTKIPNVRMRAAA